MAIEAIKFKNNPAFLSDDKLLKAFVVRQDALQSILRSIKENTGQANQHILVVGARGMGKTMLMRRTAAAIREDESLSKLWHPIVFTEESYSISNAGEFWLEAILHLSSAIGNERWKQTHEELSKEKDVIRLRERALSQLIGYAEADNKRLLLIVENMGMLFEGQINKDEAWVIRHTLLNEPRIMLLATALPRFDEIENSNKAMFELFKTYELRSLDKEECGEIWKSVTGEALVGDRVRPVQILTGGNPRLVTIISNFGTNMSLKELLGDLMRLVDDHTEYFKSHLDNLSPPERKVYVALLELWAPVSAREVAASTRMEVNETSAILARLVGKRAVEANPGRGRAKSYQSAERMFNIYWLMRKHGEPSKRVKAVVDFMVHFYGEGEIGGVLSTIAEIEAFENSIKLNPSLGSSWLGLNRVLLKQKKTHEVFEKLKEYYRDNDRVKATMDIAISLAVEAAAAGFVRETITVLSESPSAQLLEPLLAGLRMYNGEEINVPKEVRDVAQDVVEKIKLSSPLTP